MCVLTLIHVNECPSYNICGSRIQCSSQMKFTKVLKSIKGCSSLHVKLRLLLLTSLYGVYCVGFRVFL